MNIIETNLNFNGLVNRRYTDMIVVHHTGCNDIDATAQQIHGWHLGQGWSGIGYHFVIRKNGSIERGRPEWAVGSHAYGENSHTLGIHLSGDFESAQPTNEQIANCAELVHNLCEKYDIPIDRKHIVGHCDLMATSCPGQFLYSRLDEIIFKAKGQRIKEHPASIISKDNVYFYGCYNFNSSDHSLEDFLSWLQLYPIKDFANYGNVLSAQPIHSDSFREMWQRIGNIDPGHFELLQDEFFHKKENA